MNILEEIKQHKLREVAERKSLYHVKLLEQSIYFKLPPVSLRKHLGRPDLNGIIAEFKRRSPSKGVINQHSDVAVTCTGYIQAGATALSVLTDEKYFGGSTNDLRVAREMNHCPILQKDFIIDEYQIVEAKAIGADAVLLIAATLDKKSVLDLARFARSINLEVLLEVHNEEELDCANEYVNVVGVNNRDLKTFTVDLERSFSLACRIPPAFVKISESGISSALVIKKLRSAGYHGFLIGENFMRTPEPVSAFTDFVKLII
jgi:indole-3-glycerol phosphate synthase